MDRSCSCNRFLFIQIAWSASESECATCANPPFAALTRSALNTLVSLTCGGTGKLLISASPLQPQDKLAAAVICAFEWILANNSGRRRHRLHCAPFIYLSIYYFCPWTKQREKRQPEIHFAFSGRSHQCKTIRELPSSLENEIIHELFHPRCGDLCLVRLHDSAFHGPFDAPLLAVLCG